MSSKRSVWFLSDFYIMAILLCLNKSYKQAKSNLFIHQTLIWELKELKLINQPNIFCVNLTICSNPHSGNPSSTITCVSPRTPNPTPSTSLLYKNPNPPTGLLTRLEYHHKQPCPRWWCRKNFSKNTPFITKIITPTSSPLWATTSNPTRGQSSKSSPPTQKPPRPAESTKSITWYLAKVCFCGSPSTTAKTKTCSQNASSLKWSTSQLFQW